MGERLTTGQKNQARRRRIYEAARGADGFVRCHWCRDPLPFSEMTLEHLKPRHAGGTNQASNLRPACYDCNHNRGRGLGWPVESIAEKSAPDRKARKWRHQLSPAPAGTTEESNDG